MASVKLGHEQYSSYDADGELLATRSVRVHTLSEESEQGPGICAVLRTGEELSSNGDGIGVALTITDDQLEELGYVKAGESTAFITMADILASMPEPTIEDIEGIELEDFEDYQDYAFCKVRGMIRPSDHGGGDDLEVFCTILDQWVDAGPHILDGEPKPCVDRRAVKIL